MGKGIKFIGKAEEALIPVFGSDTRSVGCAYGGGTVGATAGGGRHENRAARDDVCNDLVSGVTGVDHVRSLWAVGEHPTDQGI